MIRTGSTSGGPSGRPLSTSHCRTTADREASASTRPSGRTLTATVRFVRSDPGTDASSHPPGLGAGRGVLLQLVRGRPGPSGLAVEHGQAPGLDVEDDQVRACGIEAEERQDLAGEEGAGGPAR